MAADELLDALMENVGLGLDKPEETSAPIQELTVTQSSDDETRDALTFILTTGFSEEQRDDSEPSSEAAREEEEGDDLMANLGLCFDIPTKSSEITRKVRLTQSAEDETMHARSHTSFSTKQRDEGEPSIEITREDCKYKQEEQPLGKDESPASDKEIMKKNELQVIKTSVGREVVEVNDEEQSVEIVSSQESGRLTISFSYSMDHEAAVEVVHDEISPMIEDKSIIAEEEPSDDVEQEDNTSDEDFLDAPVSYSQQEDSVGDEQENNIESITEDNQVVADSEEKPEHQEASVENKNADEKEETHVFELSNRAKGVEALVEDKTAVTRDDTILDHDFSDEITASLDEESAIKVTQEDEPRSLKEEIVVVNDFTALPPEPTSTTVGEDSNSVQRVWSDSKAVTEKYVASISQGTSETISDPKVDENNSGVMDEQNTNPVEIHEQTSHDLSDELSSFLFEENAAEVTQENEPRPLQDEIKVVNAFAALAPEPNSTTGGEDNNSIQRVKSDSEAVTEKYVNSIWQGASEILSDPKMDENTSGVMDEQNTNPVEILHEQTSHDLSDEFSVSLVEESAAEVTQENKPRSLKDEIKVVNDFAVLAPEPNSTTGREDGNLVQKVWSDSTAVTEKYVNSISQDTSGTLSDPKMDENTSGVIDEQNTNPAKILHKRISHDLMETSGTAAQDANAEYVVPHDDITRPVTSSTKLGSYFLGTAPAMFASNNNHWKLLMTEGTCRAFGQVVFCNNPITGILIWVAMMVASPLVGMCALVCAKSANLTAILVGMDRNMVRKGLLAYNAVLVGSGISNFLVFESGWIVSVLISLLAGPVALLAYVYAARVVSPAASPLLFPFNGVMVFVLLSAMLWDSTTVVSLDDIEEGVNLEFIGALCKGVSSILLVSNVVSGVLVVVGMVFCSRILAVAVLAGSALGALGGFALFDTPVALINNGAAGFNVALTVGALHYFVVPSTKSSLVLGMFGVILTLLTQTATSALFSILSLPVTVMAIPFCLATLPIISLDIDILCGDVGFVTLLPLLELTTPEEYLESSSLTTTKSDHEPSLFDDIEAKGGSRSSPATEKTPLIAK